MSRKAAEKLLLERIAALPIPNNPNLEMYKERLKGMSDKEWDEWMNGIEDGTKFFPIIVPNEAKYIPEIPKLLKACRAIGHEPFEPIWMSNDGLEFLSNEPYLNVHLTIRRLVQHLFKKMSVSNTDTAIDELTGQASSRDSTSSISFPELALLKGLGLDTAPAELVHVRGGDLDAMKKLDASIDESGHGRTDQAMADGTKVKSTETLDVLFKAMHLKLDL